MGHGEGSIKGTGAAKVVIYSKYQKWVPQHYEYSWTHWKEAIGEYNFTFKNT